MYNRYYFYPFCIFLITLQKSITFFHLSLSLISLFLRVNFIFLRYVCISRLHFNFYNISSCCKINFLEIRDQTNSEMKTTNRTKHPSPNMTSKFISRILSSLLISTSLGLLTSISGVHSRSNPYSVIRVSIPPNVVLNGDNFLKVLTITTL